MQSCCAAAVFVGCNAGLSSTTFNVKYGSPNTTTLLLNCTDISTEVVLETSITIGLPLVSIMIEFSPSFDSPCSGGGGRVKSTSNVLGYWLVF